MRVRKLLLHNYEIRKLYGKLNERGYALIPLRLYFREGKVKILVGLAKGKRQYDKRESMRRRDQKRDLDRIKKEYK